MESLYYSCNSKNEYLTIANAMMDASRHIDTVFYLFDDFTERYLYDQSLKNLKVDMEYNPLCVTSFFQTCADQIRAAKLELDIFTNPQSCPLNFELKLNQERQEIIKTYSNTESDKEENECTEKHT